MPSSSAEASSAPLGENARAAGVHAWPGISRVTVPVCRSQSTMLRSWPAVAASRPVRSIAKACTAASCPRSSRTLLPCSVSHQSRAWPPALEVAPSALRPSADRATASSSPPASHSVRALPCATSHSTKVVAARCARCEARLARSRWPPVARAPSCPLRRPCRDRSSRGKIP